MMKQMEKLQSKTVGILSDTHGSIHPGVLEKMNACDLIIHAGDICGGHVLEQLTPKTGEIVAVRGNNDVTQHWVQESTYTLKELSDERRIDLPGGSLAVIHGHQYWSREDPQSAILSHFPDARAVVYGHSHYVQHEKIDDRWLLNPGAAGNRLNRGGSSCLILRASEESWKVEMYRFVNE
jgi:putative phosphoesterase